MHERIDVVSYFCLPIERGIRLVNITCLLFFIDSDPSEYMDIPVRSVHALPEGLLPNQGPEVVRQFREAERGRFLGVPSVRGLARRKMW